MGINLIIKRFPLRGFGKLTTDSIKRKRVNALRSPLSNLCPKSCVLFQEPESRAAQVSILRENFRFINTRFHIIIRLEADG